MDRGLPREGGGETVRVCVCVFMQVTKERVKKKKSKNNSKKQKFQHFSEWREGSQFTDTQAQEDTWYIYLCVYVFTYIPPASPTIY